MLFHDFDIYYSFVIGFMELGWSRRITGRFENLTWVRLLLVYPGIQGADGQTELNECYGLGFVPEKFIR